MKVRPPGVRPIPECLGNYPNLSELAMFTPCTIGKSNSYLSDIFSLEELNKVAPGQSICIMAPVGSGKTTATIGAVIQHHEDAVIVTNRKSSYVQMKRDVLKAQGKDTRDWSEGAIETADTGRITVTTYQKLVQIEHPIKYKKGTILVLDEIHYLLNDSTFSAIPMRIKEILQMNLDTTRRIYISATMEEVSLEIVNIEQRDISNYGSSVFRSARIQHLYLMESNWNHLEFRFYNYANVDELADTLNEAADNKVKSAVFLRNKTRGNLLKDKLKNSQFVYSSEEEQETLASIALNESFPSNCLLATKVLENGVSINDEDIGIIVVEEIDPVSFMQFLGRVRVKRNHPRTLVVMIPDYTVSELRQVSRQCYEKMDFIKRVIDSPETCMMHYERYTPYVYYSYDGPRANIYAYKKFSLLKTHVDTLIQDTEPHAHLRYILRMLELPEIISDSQFLNYDDIAAYKTGVRTAYGRFSASRKHKEDRDLLAKDLIKVAAHTSYYKKKITGSQLQLERINEMLALAGIEATIASIGETFAIE
ncbi:MAG: DEAD/DEAH box helicase [Oscillospiraceae bacterium]|nr:DEAD/DEAH box helicase [Oscillospiraceae bacterium]